MSANTPEELAILEQVALELFYFRRARETGMREVGTVIIHCGQDKLIVEVNRKRVNEPVHLENKGSTLLKRAP